MLNERECGWLLWAGRDPSFLASVSRQDSSVRGVPPRPFVSPKPSHHWGSLPPLQLGALSTTPQQLHHSAKCWIRVVFSSASGVVRHAKSAPVSRVLRRWDTACDLHGNGFRMKGKAEHSHTR